MTKLPRDINGFELSKKLKILGYKITRQNGSHIRLSTAVNGEHHITIPRHDPLKIGTLAGILQDLSLHHKMERNELITKVFG